MYDQDQKRKSIRKPIIDVPSTTDSVVVFSWHRKWRRFDRSEYKPEYSDGEITHEKIDHFLNEIDHLVRKVLRKDSILCFLFFVMIILAAVFGYIIKKFSHGGYVFLFLACWVVLIVLITGIMVMQRQKNLQTTKDLVKKYIKKHHSKFKAFGLRWHIPKHFPLWIELRKQLRTPKESLSSENSLIVQMTNLPTINENDDELNNKIQEVLQEEGANTVEILIAPGSQK